MRVSFIVIIIALFSLSACSKEPAPPVSKAPAVRLPAGTATDKPLVDVVHDAVRFYAEGGKEFAAPAGVVVSRGSTRQYGVETVVIAGVQQRGPSMASITASFPAAWFSSEREKLDGLKAEIGELTGCADRLSKGTTGDSSCRVEEVTANGMPGIAISAKKAPHLTMTMVSAR